MPTTRVTVAIPTFNRLPDLALLLAAIVPELGRVPPAFEVDVLVVDNDPQASARTTTQNAGLPLRYVVEPEPGVSAVRNRALAECSDRRLVAFIDDDERPAERWLSSLLDRWERSGRPVGVSGRIVPEYLGDVDPWLLAGGFFVRRNMPSGSEIEQASTNNLLIDVEQVLELGVAFDPRFGLSGGEDSLFTRQLVRAGGRIVWCAESIVYDRVPPERLARGWVLRRARSHGNSTGLVALELAGSRRARGLIRVRLALGGAARAGVGAVGALIGVLTRSPRRDARARRMAMRGVGILNAVFGQRVLEYARVDSEDG